MTKRNPQSQPKWTDVKAKLASLDRLGLIGLIQDLYASDKDNQTFLHTRFGLGEHVLNPYKKTLQRWLWPDVLRNQNTSVAKAKQAISQYRKAVGEPAGLADLIVFYCENAAGFCNDVGNGDVGYLNAMINMFERALDVTRQLPAADRHDLIVRLDRVRTISHKLPQHLITYEIRPEATVALSPENQYHPDTEGTRQTFPEQCGNTRSGPLCVT